MMNDEDLFNKWMDDLIALADKENIDLELKKYSYYIYFARGFEPKDVVGDFKGLTEVNE